MSNTAFAVAAGIALSIALLPIRGQASEGLLYGNPGRADVTVDHAGFALGYSKHHLQPRWVAYRLTKDRLSSSVSERSQNYFQDRECFPGLVASSDYAILGCDVGHMACAGDMKWSMQAELESFYFSNMCPQKPGFNRGIWKVLEGVVRGFAYSEGSVFVITGPVLSDSHIAAPDIPGGRKRIPIPEWFYKVVYDETEPKKMIGFLIPHKEGLHGVRNYACTVEDVEKRTGLVFFCSIKPEDLGDMKKRFDIKQWSWMVK